MHTNTHMRNTHSMYTHMHTHPQTTYLAVNCPLQVHLDSLGTLKLADFSHSCLCKGSPSCQTLLSAKNATREETESTRTIGESSSTSSTLDCCQHPSDSEPEMRPHTPGAILSQKEGPEHHTVDTHGALSAPYLAPECRSGQHPTEHSDLWGLGCLSFQLFCGKQWCV